MCNSCDAIAINGVNCHEQGCPDSWLNPLTDEPNPVECAECGSMFIPDVRGQYCCDRDCNNAYNGWSY